MSYPKLRSFFSWLAATKGAGKQRKKKETRPSRRLNKKEGEAATDGINMGLLGDHVESFFLATREEER